MILFGDNGGPEVAGAERCLTVTPISICWREIMQKPCSNRCCLLSSILAVALVILPTGSRVGHAADLPVYVAPDLKPSIFGGKLTFDATQQKAAATALAGLARNALNVTQVDGMRDASRLLGLALRLDPKNRAAVVANGYLADGQQPKIQQDWNQQDAVDSIRHAAQTANATAKPADAAAAGYLYAALPAGAGR